MTAALRLWWLLGRRERSTDRLPTVLAVTAFAVAGAALLVVLSGLHAMVGRWQAGLDPETDSLYLILSVTAAGLMTIPILTLGGQAARLTLARRDQRLAALRLAGATSGQAAVLTIVETASQAAIGAVLGTGLYGLSLPVLTLISFQGRNLGLNELWLGPWLLAALAVVLLLAIVSAAVSLARVVVTPLGVASRVTPRRLTVLRLVVAVLMLLGWPVLLPFLPVAGVIVFGLALVAVINIVGPWLVMLFALALAGLSRRAPTLLAARRIVDDPRTAWRSVSAFALVIMLAMGSAWAASFARSAEEIGTLSADMATGALITLVIVSVVAATSSGVVHACRVIDNRSLHQSLVLAGTEVEVLDATRLREVAWPLLVTAITAGGFAMMLMLPLQADLPVALTRFGLATGGSVVLTLVALAASHRLLVRTASPVGST